jgi:tyrosine-protein phosphatase SIW14
MRTVGPGTSTLKAPISKMIVVAVLLMLVAPAGLAQVERRYDELPNFHKVDERLYRGAQPKSGGIKVLSELGIKTIINLRGADEQTRAEEAEAKAGGLTYFNIPMPGLSRPTHGQVSRVMAILESDENRPIFIHCKHGSDRTGTIVALYRISNHGWTANQAMSEARNYGLSWIEFGMKDYVSDYYRDQNISKQTSSEKFGQQPTTGIVH